MSRRLRQEQKKLMGSQRKSGKPAVKRPAGKPYHHGDLRQALLNAALELVDETGPRGFSLAQVCRQAGVSMAAPYRHFEDKESLLAAVCQSSFVLFRETLLAAKSACGKDVRQRLKALAHAYLSFAETNESRFRIMFSANLPKSRFPELYATARSAFEITLETVADCQGFSDATSPETYTQAVSLWSNCHGLAALMIDGYLREISVEQRIPELIDLMIERFINSLPDAAEDATAGLEPAPEK
jgi:AcrR family transcriptional regulator